MVMTMVSNHGIDPARVFVTGLSAGGAMTSVMLATYPDAIVAGLSCGAATNVQQAFETMHQCPPRAAVAWGDLVRKASRHNGPWPRVSVWHGGADGTVVPSNAAEIIKQWTEVHGVPVQPSFEAKVDGYPRQVWLNGEGEEMIESYTITRMAHGTPLATGAADNQCGVAGPFLLEVGISSSYHIARFFGLTSARGAAKRSPRQGAITVAHVLDETDRPTAPAEPVDAKMIEPDAWPGSQQPALDIGAVITKALRTAGLLKSG
jgi:poly(3-hydroxybutyrate) depolymerase